MATPNDENLYRKIKTEVDAKYPTPSAYRSMAYTRFYQKAYEEKYGSKKAAYKGKNPEELKTWRKEKWLDVKSVIRDPKNPTACGNEPYKKGEYPLCIKEKEIAKYSKGELELLRKRKSELGSKRLVKDAFLRDVLTPDETPAKRLYKDKYQKDKKLKLPKPLPEAQAEKVLAEKPIGRIRETQQKVKIPVVAEEKRPRGRPRLEPEVLAENKKKALEKKLAQRSEVKALNQKEREAKRKTKEEEKQMLQAQKPQKPKAEPFDPNKYPKYVERPADNASKEEFDYYRGYIKHTREKTARTIAERDTIRPFQVIRN
jgi:hypothetical protein